MLVTAPFAAGAAAFSVCGAAETSGMPWPARAATSKERGPKRMASARYGGLRLGARWRVQISQRRMLWQAIGIVVRDREARLAVWIELLCIGGDGGVIAINGGRALPRTTLNSV